MTCFVKVLAVGQLRPPNVNWEYMMHDKTLHSLAFRVSYEWRTKDEWTPCDKQCHGKMQNRKIDRKNCKKRNTFLCVTGIQKQKIFCIQTSDNQETEDKNCENSRKPDVHQRVCNMHCQLRLTFIFLLLIFSF